MLTVDNMRKLLNGESIKVLNGYGSICIDLEYNKFLPVITDGISLNLHDTFEDALQELEDFMIDE